MTDRLARINELAALARQRDLTPEETAERDRLRQEYLAAFRENLRAQLDNTWVVEPDGTKHRLERKK